MPLGLVRDLPHRSTHPRLPCALDDPVSSSPMAPGDLLRVSWRGCWHLPQSETTRFSRRMLLSTQACSKITQEVVNGIVALTPSNGGMVRIATLQMLDARMHLIYLPNMHPLSVYLLATLPPLQFLLYHGFVAMPSHSPCCARQRSQTCRAAAFMHRSGRQCILDLVRLAHRRLPSLHHHKQICKLVPVGGFQPAPKHWFLCKRQGMLLRSHAMQGLRTPQRGLRIRRFDLP